MSVRVQVVGTLAVEHDGARVEGGSLAARRTRLLLVALAAAEGRSTAAELAARLWEDPPPTWSAALRGAIAALRGALEPIGLGGTTLIRTEPDGWRLAAGVSIDLAEAEAAAAAAVAALADGRAADAVPLAETAIGLLDGEVLAADDAPWLDAVRRRRQTADTTALGALAQASLALGRWSAVVTAASLLLERDPLDEPAARLLIRALAASGDRAGAIRAFERCRSALVDELGVDPSPETTAVYLEVLQSGSAPSGALPPVPRNRFVGRAGTQRAVLDAIGSGAAVTLVGRGGMGKSRLALEVAHDRRTPAPGGRFWVGLGDLPDPELVPSAIAAAVAAENGPDPLAAAIATLAPADQSLLVLDGCERHLDAVADAVTGLLAGVPGLAVLCTSRAPVGFEGERRIDVGSLEQAGPALLRTRLAERAGTLLADAADDASLAALSDRIGGAPLAIELAAAQLATLSVGDLLDGIDQAAEQADGVLGALVEQSWSALDAPETILLRALGVVEGTVPLPLARAVAGDAVPGPRVARMLGTLAEAGFVVVDRAGVRWRYGVDPHLRAFVRARTGEQEAHAGLTALAVALGELAPTDAKAPPGPYRPAVDAAVDALRTVFDAAATGRIDRVLALDTAFRLHRYWAATGVAEGRYWLGRLLDGAPAGEPADLARFGAGYLAYWAGDAVATAELLPVAADGLEADQPDFAARALLYAGGISDDLDEPDRAVDQLARSLALARRVGGPLVASVELGLAAVLAERGDRAAVAAADRAIAGLVGDVPQGQWQAMHVNAALSAWRVGDPAAVRRFAAEAAPVLAAGPSIARTHLTIALAGSALLEGRWSEALGFAETGLDDQRTLGVERDIPLTAAIAARAALALGQRDEAHAHAVAALAAADDLGIAAVAAPALEAAVLLRQEHPAAPAVAASAAAVRAVGKRPAPPGMAPVAVGAAPGSPWREAVHAAQAMLA